MMFYEVRIVYKRDGMGILVGKGGPRDQRTQPLNTNLGNRETHDLYEQLRPHSGKVPEESPISILYYVNI